MKTNNSEYADSDGMDLMHGADGDRVKLPAFPSDFGKKSAPASTGSKSGGNVSEKINKGIDLAKEGVDIVNSVKGLFGKPRKTTSPQPTGTRPASPPEKKGMSTGAKVAIGAGVALLIGGIIYVATRKSK